MSAAGGRLVVISGPGGVGKGTVAARLVAAADELDLSRSWTTRTRREGEPEDAYVFVSRDEFERHERNGGFLEWAEFLGNCYGTPMPNGPRQRDLILEIDVQGARQVIARYPDSLVIFLDAPSRADQEARLRSRGDAEGHVHERLAKAAEEASAAAELGAVVVINDDLDSTVEEILRLIRR